MRSAAVPPALRTHSWKGALARRFLARRGAVLARLPAQARDDLALVHETRRRTALLMTDAAALHLVACVRAASGLDGAMAEAGVLMGGSARLIATAKGRAPLHLFDVFETLQASDAPRTALGAHFGGVHGTLAAVEGLLAPLRASPFIPAYSRTRRRGWRICAFPSSISIWTCPKVRAPRSNSSIRVCSPAASCSATTMPIRACAKRSRVSSAGSPRP
ncbi:hypothetical protein PIB19_04650 [Sphingomonas sp. 7/4-4]|nr:hypothetical protein [Sphingomonas sp. 7/4-4]WBY08735.1 hypothetical protein PIB19_04650 [Sphingomonas sp. 7/4-4]